ncbi:alpha/beta-hydrolase [Anaeromyces robustus]|uniref:Alpha/beta-hydrolase n=1 Tax=Anaeromyces robustus TaxID=1754192 RepID=A0A1Y1WWI6_9FUNG|nr:alpha/beta-hydrolase [Anaeromyces robustus]|eukprot:ORX77566.1 alpha/beta-hydrolase [Anaeromyces robustus]
MKSSLIAKLLLVFTLYVSLCSAGYFKDKITDFKDRQRDLKYYKGIENIERDIRYNSKDRLLDVFYRKEEVDKKKPVVVFFYGGSWKLGDKIKFSRVGTLLEENDYVAVVPTYILFPFGGFDDMVEDVYKSIKWTYENIEKYGGDPNRITIAGHSAGAHLMALSLFKSYYYMENKGKTLQPLPKLEKFVSLAGPYDFDDYSLVKKFFGTEMDNSFLETLCKAVFRSKDVSPYDIIKAKEDNSVDDSFNVKKFVFYYTSLDKEVPECSAKKLMTQLKRVSENINIEYVYKEGYVHNAITVGMRAGDKEQGEIFLSLLKL